MLFHNRMLNELASELCAMFPIFGTTHSYRVQHLGHHHIPMTERDPDWGANELERASLQIPMTRLLFLWHCVIKQIVLPIYPLRYALVRPAMSWTKGKVRHTAWNGIRSGN